MIPHDFDAALFQASLETTRYGRSVRFLESTTSTNDVARADAESGHPVGHVVVADTQNAGRGSHGRAWSSPPGTDLYFSIVEKPDVSLAQLPGLTLAVGLGVAEGIERSVDQRALVKWPNDVWLGGRKCCGILVESASTAQSLGPVILGVGVNVNRTEFPEELREIATSLALASGRDAVARLPLLQTLLRAIELRVNDFVRYGTEHIVKALEPRLALVGEHVSIEGYGIGTLDAILPDGSLRLVTRDGVRTAVAGTLRRAD